MRVKKFFHALVMLSFPLLAQPLPPMLKLQDQAHFTEKGAWVFLPLGPEPVSVKARGKQLKQVVLSTEGLNFGYRAVRNGQLYDVRRAAGTKDGKPDEHIYLLRAPLENEATKPAWERLAEIDNSGGEPHLLVPLDKAGRFLAFGPYRGFHKEGLASPAAIFRLEGDYLKLDELVELPWGGRKHIGVYREEALSLPGGVAVKGADGKPRIHRSCEVQPRALSPNLLLPAILDDHLVLAASKTGVLWFLSLANGRCARMVDLGGVSAEGMEKLGHLDHFLLGIQPDRQQRLVALTRSKDVLSFAQALDSPKGVSMEVRQANRARFQETVQGFTDLHWWRVDPETGAKVELDEPSSNPARAMSYSQHGLVRFLVGPDGRIHANTHGSWKDTLEQLGVKPLAATPQAEPVKPVPDAPRPPAKSLKPGSKS